MSIPRAPMVGLDLEAPDRLARRLMKRPGLEDRLFTPGERAYCNAQARPDLHFTARFCAKEAVVKALALDTFEPQEIEVVGGGPDCRLVLHGSAQARAEQLGVLVTLSLSHIDQLAGAVVLALPFVATDASR